MTEGPSANKKLKIQNEFDKSPNWANAFRLTSVQAIYPAFAVLQLGPDCNAHMSVPFTDAKCNFRKVGLEVGGLYMIDFDDIFSMGIDLLIDLQNNSRELTEEEQRAVDILDHFLKDKDSRNGLYLEKENNIKAPLREVGQGKHLEESGDSLFLPDPADHRKHLVGEFPGLSQPVDETIISKIHLLVHEGTQSVDETKRHFHLFVKDTISPGNTISEFNRCFYPANKDDWTEYEHTHPILQRYYVCGGRDFDCIHCLEYILKGSRLPPLPNDIMINHNYICFVPNRKTIDSEKHQQSLHKVLGGCKSEEEKDEKTNSFETHMTIALAEHLFGKLAPGQSYVIDNRVRGKKEKEMCQCRLDHCHGRPKFDCTGIGDEKAWHGFLDIVFSSHPVAAITTQELYGDENDEESETVYDEDSPDGKTICEMQLNHGAENQAIAQTIVFSYIQRKRHPSFQNYLIPNILISPYHFRILMYDSLNDILICSVKLPIFQDKEKCEKLSVESIVFLWIVLHYRIFCVGINVTELLNSGSIKDLRDIQSNFPERAREKFKLYEESSTIGISSFLPIPEEIFPSLDSFLYGKRLFKPRRLWKNSI